jgi:hypothetical protein
VLFAVDPQDGTIKPDHQRNIPGTHLLADADLMVLFTRFRELPDAQMQPIVEFASSGKPMLGLRTATHAFNYEQNKQSPFAKYSWNSSNPQGGFGQLVLGDTWINHHGRHGRESTRGVINPSHAAHPILRGVDDIWGPTDVYGIVHLPTDAEVLVHGQVLAGMEPSSPPVSGAKNDPMMPLVWVRNYRDDLGHSARVACTTMGASQDLQSAGLRRLLINACYWCLGLEDRIAPDSSVDYVGSYRPTAFGFRAYTPGVRPQDHRLETN